MADVAKRAEVSVTTVSHVVNGTRRVAVSTVDRVMQAITETGYRPNRAAQALATSSSASIGLAMSFVTNPYFGELAHQLEERLRQATFSLVLANTNDDPAQALDVIDDLEARQIAGLIAVPLEGDEDLDTAFRRMVSTGFPLVFLDRRSNLPVDQVHSDGERSIFRLTEHLARLGHQRIGMVTGTESTASGQYRTEGYLRAVEELGLDSDEALILPGESDEHIAELVVHERMAAGNRPTALVVANNQMAIGALRALRDLELHVPEDVALVSFDDFAGAELIQPGLTVVRQDVDRLASAAVRLLLRRMSKPDRRPETIEVPTTFIHRGSCGCH